MMTKDTEFTPDLWLKCLCAWNNVPCDNKAMKKYTDESWGKVSVEGWKRVAETMKEHFARAEQPSVEGILKDLDTLSEIRTKRTPPADNKEALCAKDDKPELCAKSDIVEALSALDMIKHHHNQVSEQCLQLYVETIRTALQSQQTGNE